MEKIRVGLFVDTFYPMMDGVISVVNNYATRLKDYGCDVVVFCPDGRVKFDDSQLPYKVVRCTKRFKLGFLDYDLPEPKRDQKFMKQLDDYNLDIIHIHSPFTIGRVGVDYAKKHNIPCVITMHSQYKKDFRKESKSLIITRILMNRIMYVFNHCDECWVMNPFGEKLIREYGYKGKIDTISNATALVPDGHVDEYEKLLENMYNLNDVENVFSFVGRMNRLKNIGLMIDALKIAKDNGLSFKTILIGDGPDKKRFIKKVNKLGLSENIIFANKVVDKKVLMGLYSRSDLFLFPSTYDTDGIVKIEAAGLGTPSICVKGSGAASTITDGVNGFLIENNAQALADKIMELCKNKELIKKAGEQAHKDIYVTWDNVVKEVSDRYRKFVNKKQ